MNSDKNVINVVKWMLSNNQDLVDAYMELEHQRDHALYSGELDTEWEFNSWIYSVWNDNSDPRFKLETEQEIWEAYEGDRGYQSRIYISNQFPDTIWRMLDIVHAISHEEEEYFKNDGWYTPQLLNAINTGDMDEIKATLNRSERHWNNLNEDWGRYGQCNMDKNGYAKELAYDGPYARYIRANDVVSCTVQMCNIIRQYFMTLIVACSMLLGDSIPSPYTDGQEDE